MKAKRFIDPSVAKMRVKHLGDGQRFFKISRSISARTS